MSFKISLYSLIILIVVAIPELKARDINKNINSHKNNTKTESKKKKTSKELIPFSFTKKPLHEIVNLLAEKYQINVLFPQNPTDYEILKNQTVTYQPDMSIEVPLNKAWDLLMFFLEMSGYSLYKKGHNLYAITRIGKKEEEGISRETLPLYISVKSEDLPDSEERIRYIHYFQNLKAPADAKEDNPLNQIFKDMSSDGAPDPDYLPKTNGVVLVDRANVISSIISIIQELDHSGFRETIEVIPINYIPAKEVAEIFEKLKAAAGPEKQPPFYRAEHKAGGISFFAQDTKIVPDARNNALILMGRESAVRRISEFVHDYIDVIPQSGKSILHYYDLQYLNAQQFDKVLQNMVRTEPAAQAAEAAAGGPERFLQGVYVKAEEIVEAQKAEGFLDIKFKAAGQVPQGGQLDAKGITNVIKTGGNRLVIAALQDDWPRIKDLIEKLDKPRPQVILEVMIVEFTRNRTKIISGDVRNKTQQMVPTRGFEFLASHIQPVNNVLGSSTGAAGASPVQLAQDLLSIICPNFPVTNPSCNIVGPQNVVAQSSPGSMLISFNDPATPGIFGLINILDQFVDTRIMSHPFLISTNNTRATITQQLIKRARGDATAVTSGAIKIDIDPIPASIQVQMIPRLSAPDRLSLQIGIDINEFTTPTSLDRVTRRIETNAILNTGQILVLGGLTRTENDDTKTDTPILSRIPIIGWFFQGVTRAAFTTNVVVFVSPTIVHPKLREGMDLYTKDKIRKGRRDTDDDLVFGFTRDPITKLFFPNTNKDNINIMKEYLDQTSNAPTFEEIKTTREKRYEELHPSKRPAPAPIETSKTVREIPA